MSPTLRRPALLICCILAGGCGSSHASSTRSTSTAPRSGVELLPGGVRTVAQGRVPRGPAFAIVAERYRFQGRLYDDLEVQLEPHAGPAGASGSFTPDTSAQAFSWTAQLGCSLHPAVRWAILYGLLRGASDRVEAYEGTRPRMLRTAAVAPELRFPGVAAFAVLAGPPTRVRVFGPSGTVVEDVTLALPVAARCDPRSSGGLLHVGGPG